MAYIRIVLFCCLFSFSFAFGQKPSAHKKAQAAYLEAGKALRANAYKQAEQQLLQAVAFDPSFATAYQQLADIYRKLEDYEKAAKAYQEVLKLDPKLTSLTYFGLGESLLFTGHYQEALQNLEFYKSLGKLPSKSEMLTNKYIKDCQFSLSATSGQQLFQLVPLGDGVNTADDEYFPKLTADNKTIIFTRKTANQENFYESQLLDGKWSLAEKLIGKINSAEFNEGAHCISPDGKYLFFTGCNWPNGLGSCDIYVSKRENGVWGTPHNLGAPVNSSGWESQPAISADGKTLYFVSNRAGSLGGYDIYKSLLKADGSWDVPVNLGPSINSPYDESAPYIHADNKTLYFASDGWPGFGRKDIFKSILDANGNWSIPQNMGSSINNFRDQTAMHVSMNGKIGHLASQSPAGQLDIYSFELPEVLRPGAIAYLKGTVLDAKNLQALPASIRVTDILTNQLVFADEADLVDGSFLATLPIGHSYAVHIQHKGYLLASKQYALDRPEFANEAFESEIRLQPIEKGSTGLLNNIFFAVNSFELLPTSHADLAAFVDFLRVNPGASIEIGGHTDNSGNPQANQLLSENRAKAVRNYLIAQGVASHRLTVKGYGQSLPIAANDSEAGKQLNRRTALTVTGI